ncbi:hypothetical protein AXE80_04825 [Wenyingzhuangia fucanilytica]|uniref:LVIVD repeat protein n=1 Tax=Wenyingzhuangia fucanilytica TaxID=1790137 RepID=A0A1B1Y4E4_9FLAO|nr:hypothetical protein [Wenyingzhuangia fucanilytica]ANW95642.1 hypothetical protein AXE80_04825 [Wenyingzhuangia fucanilytica]
MKKIAALNLLILLVLVASCSSKNTDDIKEEQKEVILNNTNQTDRLNTSKSGVLSIKEAPDEDPEEAKNTKATFKTSTINESDIASNIPLIQIAEVSAPKHNGTTLRATHVAINGNYAYVSYNVEGPTYLGAVDVIDISNPNSPSIALSAILPNTDISAVNYYNNALYLAGASSSINSDGTHPAVLIKMELENGLPTDNIALIDIPSYVATDVLANENGIYGVSGVDGVLAQYDISNLTLKENVSINDLRALGEHDNKIIVLSGTDGITVHNSNLTEISSFTTSTDTPEAKRTIDFYNNNVLVAEGKQGLGIYNINNGNKLTTIDLPTVTDTNIDPDEIVTNAVTVESEHIFMANWAAGVTVHDLTEGTSNITTIGTLEIDGSTNYVKSANGYIFVASGNGGLKIIKTVANTNTETNIDCTNLPPYIGGYWLNINSNENKAYSGSTSLMGLNVSANLTFCGTLAVSNGLHINSNGHFKMSGTLAQGNAENPWNSLIINDGILEVEGTLIVYGNMTFNNAANLKVLGDVTIYGDVTINNNVTIDFLGANSSITIHGNVIKNGTPTINGNYTDTFNKL